MKKFYITSAIPYVNASPHIGHALEFIQTDAIARYHTQLGDAVTKLCGGDENALKNVQAAEKTGKPVQEYVDENNALFESLADRLLCHYDVWQKGSDTKHHFASSQELWKRCAQNKNSNGAPDIYSKSYEGLYCIGCEAFYTNEELNENGECYEHPGKKLESVRETNYFFRLSRYQEQLKTMISQNSVSIIPDKRKNEILAFIDRGLEDISISRSNERAKNWGVPVPGDDTQRMYVWFDALNIYQSGIGFGWDDNRYESLWPADVHVIGKGITRFHAVYWIAFLISAGLKTPHKIFVHEYFTVNGQKMSKTLGNVIDPNTLIDKYGVDPLRYFFLAKFSPFNDGDFSEDEFRITYNADLANGLGNLLSRTASMAKGISDFIPYTSNSGNSLLPDPLIAFGGSYEFDKSLEMIWNKIRQTDKYINEHQVWKLEGQKKKEALQHIIDSIQEIGICLTPFLPDTAVRIRDQFSGPEITVLPSLFPRIK